MDVDEVFDKEDMADDISVNEKFIDVKASLLAFLIMIASVGIGYKISIIYGIIVFTAGVAVLHLSIIKNWREEFLENDWAPATILEGVRAGIIIFAVSYVLLLQIALSSLLWSISISIIFWAVYLIILRKWAVRGTDTVYYAKDPYIKKDCIYTSEETYIRRVEKHAMESRD